MDIFKLEDFITFYQDHFTDRKCKHQIRLHKSKTTEII